MNITMQHKVAKINIWRSGENELSFLLYSCTTLLNVVEHDIFVLIIKTLTIMQTND